MTLMPDDRKFIAVAVAHPEKPPILQAVDSQWWDFRDAFRQNGVTVAFICEDDIQQLLRWSLSRGLLSEVLLFSGHNISAFG